MRTPEGPDFTEFGYEGGGKGSTVSPTNIGGNSEVPQNESNGSLESSALLDERLKNNVAYALGGAMHPRNTTTPIWKYLLHILVVCLTIAALITRFPGVPCSHPFLSGHFTHCGEELEPPGKLIITPDFVSLSRLQSRLEYVMEDSASSSLAAVDIKCSGMALRDLSTLVKLSSIVRKDALGRDLKLFVKDAKTTGGRLQEFSSRVWAAVEQIVSLNKHTLIMLGHENHPEQSRGYFRSISGLFVSNEEAINVHQKTMQELWLQSTGLLEKTLRKLIIQARDNVSALEKLQEKLSTIQDIVFEEAVEIVHEEQKFDREWFREAFGMNQEKRQSNSANLEILRVVHDERQRALVYATGVLDKLEDMSRHLEYLRDEVATPLIVAGSSSIPIEVQLKNIRDGTERLVYGQTHMKEIQNAQRRKEFCSK